MYIVHVIISDIKFSQCLQNAVLMGMRLKMNIQSTLVISKWKGPSKTVRDIHTSTYQICSIEEKTI